MKFKTLAVPATIAASTAFAGTANATATIDVNVDYWANLNPAINIGGNPTEQYYFGEASDGSKSLLVGSDSATVAAPGSSPYDKVVQTSGSGGAGDGDYGLKFAVNGVDYTGLATVDQGGRHISRIQASPFVASVPEPATWATMILGLGVAGAAARRRRQSAAATA